MTLWILLVLGLFVAQTLIVPVSRYFTGKSGTASVIKDALGPRDTMPELPFWAARADRAVRNMQEALPVFLSVALLLVFLGRASSYAILGAEIFFVARLLYVPLYIFGVSGLRSTAWSLAWVGLGFMIIEVFPL